MKIPMLDIFLNIALVFIILTCVLYLQIKKMENQNSKIDAKAEYIVNVVWPNEHTDIDCYLKSPNGEICFFQKREITLASLDRDDTGAGMSETYIDADGKEQVLPINEENIAIRKAVEGEYVFNLHSYMNLKPILVKVQLIRLNPTMSTLVNKEVLMGESGAEETVFRLNINKNGTPSVSYSPPELFVRKTTR
jgi:hypothetical protein